MLKKGDKYINKTRMLLTIVNVDDFYVTYELNDEIKHCPVLSFELMLMLDNYKKIATIHKVNRI